VSNKVRFACSPTSRDPLHHSQPVQTRPAQSVHSVQSLSQPAQLPLGRQAGTWRSGGHCSDVHLSQVKHRCPHKVFDAPWSILPSTSPSFLFPLLLSSSSFSFLSRLVSRSSLALIPSLLFLLFPSYPRLIAFIDLARLDSSFTHLFPCSFSPC